MTMPGPSFDAAKYKQTQHDQWNEDAAGWHRWGATLQVWFGGVGDSMLDLGKVAPGQRVLDVGSGTGDVAFAAAARVGPQGYVLATDYSENIIRYAQQIADARGIRNLETKTMDGENPDLPDALFDIVTARFSLFYMPNRQRALSEWRRLLKPGGRVVVAVFSTPDRNAWGAGPITVIRRRAQLPPPQPGLPGPFSLGAPGALEDALGQAGFRDIETCVVSAPLRMQSAAEYSRFARESFGAFNQMMSNLSHAERESVWDEVTQVMSQYEGPHGFEAPCEPIVGVGVK
jgi:SAM-dependent methyltransferase